jgi:hypothetical protein
MPSEAKLWRRSFGEDPGGASGEAKPNNTCGDQGLRRSSLWTSTDNVFGGLHNCFVLMVGAI